MKIEKLFKSFFIILILFSIFLSGIFIFNKSTSDSIGNFEEFNNFENNCKVNINSSFRKELNKNYEILKKKNDIYVFPEINNFFCLGSIRNIYVNSNENIITLEYNSSTKIFELLDTFGNIALLIILVLSKQKKITRVLFLFIIFNYSNYTLFNYSELSFSLLLPVNLGESINNYVFLKNIFLIVASLKTRNRNVILITFAYIVFLSIDYLGLFVVLSFFIFKFKFDFEYIQKQIFIFIPILFYFLKIISTFSDNFGELWINLGQRVYRGYTYFPDMQSTLFGLKCNKFTDAILIFGNEQKFARIVECYDLHGGPLDSYLWINGDIEFLSKLFINISIIILVIIYINLLKVHRDNYVFITFLIISPPMNHLIFSGNDDILILLISFATLINLKKYSLLKILFLLFIALLNLHPLPILVGVLLVSLKNRDSKIIAFSIIANFIFLYLFILDLIQNEKDITNNWLSPGYGYGIYLDSLVINQYTGLNRFLAFFILLSLLFGIYKTFQPKFIQYFEFDLGQNEYFVIPISLWLLGSFLYTNPSYRIPLFYGLIFIMYLQSNTKTKALLVIFIFIEPIILNSFITVQLITMIASNIAGYMISFLIFSKTWNYFLNSNLILQRIFPRQKS